MDSVDEGTVITGSGTGVSLFSDPQLPDSQAISTRDNANTENRNHADLLTIINVLTFSHRLFCAWFSRGSYSVAKNWLPT